MTDYTNAPIKDCTRSLIGELLVKDSESKIVEFGGSVKGMGRVRGNSAIYPSLAFTTAFSLYSAHIYMMKRHFKGW